MQINKIIIFFLFLFLFFNTKIIAQEISSLYIPKNWEALKDIPDHLTDATNYIGRLYQYKTNLYFNDSSGDLTQITDYYTAESYGAVGDGITDDTTSFNELINAIGSNNATIYIPNIYYLNSANGITFTSKIRLVGPGKFIVGSGVGNHAAITITGNGSYLANFEIVGDHSNFTNANLTTELRRNIKISADYVTCDNLTDTNSIVGLEIDTSNYCEIRNCSFVNSIITAGEVITTNYNVGIYLKSAVNCKVIGNYFNGHGNPILQGLSSYHNIINNNRIYNGDDNGIYISSGQWCEISGNMIGWCDGMGIKARDSYHLISDNLIDSNGYAGGTVGINITGNGTGDADGFNGEQTIVVGNVIRGNFVAGINTRIQDGYHFRNPLIIGNSIEVYGDPNRGNYGIQIKGRSQGTIVSENTINNCNYGILVNTDDPNIDYHRNCLIANNHIYGSDGYSIIVDYFNESAIKNNMIYDSPRYAIQATNSTNVDISGNFIEDWYHETASNVAISISGENHTIKNNYFERTNVGGISYAIRLENQSEKISIIGNVFKACDYGIIFLMEDANTDYHRYDIVSDNIFIDSNYGGIYGLELHSCLFSNNEFYDAGETPLEILDSNNVSIINNIFNDSGDSSHTLLDEAILVRGNSYQIIGNLIEAEDSTAEYGILPYGDGNADSDGYNGYDTEIKNNHIIGPFSVGIFIQADGDSRYLKNPKVINNTIEIESGGTNGIKFQGRTSEASIIGNNITGHSIGIYVLVNDPNTDTHTGLLIKNNNTSYGTNDGIVLSYVTKSLITNNVSMNAAATRSGITLSNCTYNNIMNNLCGDTQGTATQRYGIEEQNSSAYNIFENNNCENVVLYRYAITGSESLVKTNQMIVESLSGNRIFEIGEAKTYVIDPNGAARTFNPRNLTWPMINEMIVVNTADNAETITFDSAGLNQAINQNERGIFVYDGTNWLKVYVGS